MRGRVKPMIELMIFCFDTMLNYRLSQKFKLLGNGEFNHLTINLTHSLYINSLPHHTWVPPKTQRKERKKKKKFIESCGFQLISYFVDDT